MEKRIVGRMRVQDATNKPNHNSWWLTKCSCGKNKKLTRHKSKLIERYCNPPWINAISKVTILVARITNKPKLRTNKMKLCHISCHHPQQHHCRKELVGSSRMSFVSSVWNKTTSKNWEKATTGTPIPYLMSRAMELLLRFQQVLPQCRPWHREVAILGS